MGNLGVFLLQYSARLELFEMSKLKSHKGLLKRIRVTAKGKVKVRRAFGGHLRSHKSGKLMRSYSAPNYVGRADIKRIAAMLNLRLMPSK
jgi:large subunit ribosomal protein L35